MSVISIKTVAFILTFCQISQSQNGKATEQKTVKEESPPPLVFPTKTGSQCFHVKGVPTLKLRCPGGELINVQSAFFGAPKRQVCQYNLTENHCIQLADLQENCMGRYMCSVYVSNPFLMNCRTYASYMQVNYTCIPKTQIHDICSGLSIDANRGFLRTPNYPDANYTSNLHCACKLKTTGRNIKFHIHDFSLNHTKASECDSDYLKISEWGKKCGNLGPDRLPETLVVPKQEVLIEFKSNSRYQSRGFWLEFKGSGKKTSMTCGPVKKDDRKVKDPSKEADKNKDGKDTERGGEANENDLVVIDSKGTDTTLWTVKDKTDDKEPGEPFGNWVPPQLVTQPPNQSPGTKRKGISTKSIHDVIDQGEDDPEMYETYDFNETSKAFANSLSSVQLITGIVVGVLILIAVIIIIVLVFRK